MSDEGRVTPSDEMLDISPPEVTPAAGEGALGTWRFPGLAQTQYWGEQFPETVKLDLHANQIWEGCT